MYNLCQWDILTSEQQHDVVQFNCQENVFRNISPELTALQQDSGVKYKNVVLNTYATHISQMNGH